MGKEKCDCGKMGVWLYMPGYSSNKNSVSCDDCVVSKDNRNGCSCNWNYGAEQEGLPTDTPDGVENVDWRWVVTNSNDEIVITEKDKYWVYLDENGRPNPCVEYEYAEDGFDEVTLWENIQWEFNKAKRSFKRWWRKHIIAEIPDNEDF